MCGIFGVICAGRDTALARSLTLSLLQFSETRGREAVGIAIHDGERIDVLKQGGSVTQFLANPKLHALLDGGLARYAARGGGAGKALAIVGHSRLATNGTQSNVDNNQPVITHGAVALHNGIIVNDRRLVARYPNLVVQGELDSEVLAAILRSKLDDNRDLAAATRETFAEIEGSASIAMLFDDLDAMLLATNTGSLFQLTAAGGNVLAFASERFILQRVLDDKALHATLGDCQLEQIRAGHALAIHLGKLRRQSFALAGADRIDPDFAPNGHHVTIVDQSPRRENLQRCTQCILPATYPGLDLDEHGVCHYCRTWKRVAPKGEQALADAVARYRSADGSPDVIVAFSGGRDSAYGLHYVKTVLGMNPIAFTYDGGTTTELARRNQARVCGKLGVEHVVRSGDITAKRREVRKHVEACLEKPELGAVTALAEGDHDLYRHARQLRKETGIELVIFCTGARHKLGVAGVPHADKLRSLWHAAKRASVAGVYETLVERDDFLALYEYVAWDEETIVSTLRREYNWELARDTSATSRIGDGAAAFYNYIYQTVGGFTEDEVMLANMVREGHIDRDEAVRRAAEYARPRWPSIREYAQLIGFSAEEALQTINAAPKLY